MRMYEVTEGKLPRIVNLGTWRMSGQINVPVCLFPKIKSYFTHW